MHIYTIIWITVRCRCGIYTARVQGSLAWHTESFVQKASEDKCGQGAVLLIHSVFFGYTGLECWVLLRVYTALCDMIWMWLFSVYITGLLFAMKGGRRQVWPRGGVDDIRCLVHMIWMRHFSVYIRGLLFVRKGGRRQVWPRGGVDDIRCLVGVILGYSTGLCGIAYKALFAYTAFCDII